MTDDGAQPPAARRHGWVRDLPGALASLAEDFARDSMIVGTATVSVLLAIGGALSGEAASVAAGLLVGLGGAALVLTAAGRKWPIGLQWLVIAAVLAADLAVLVLLL
ncbi:hypothetical protein E1212_18860 [Jiangella ureilytica]|uniref:Uncharacterized protein n=1 Tax=Jiangella ureilytica TaxID=2530374 RepID=A0A4R4RIL9_9ACTN|nr:hypothetical protein [Jiangella ureilytica]TDC49260.1 hypothetical protein E1212_18860 [Jiangella ureilytica]